jgi:hypothetical protein
MCLFIRSGHSSIALDWESPFFTTWPTLLALVSRAAPAKVNATLMELTFMTLFISNNLIGWIGSFYEKMRPAQFWAMHAAIAAVRRPSCRAIRSSPSVGLSTRHYSNRPLLIISRLRCIGKRGMGFGLSSQLRKERGSDGALRSQPSLSTSVILFVADLFQPIDHLTVKRFLNGNMCHCGCRRSAVPMLLVRRKPNHIAWPDFLDRAAATLRPAKTGRNDQRLTEWMCMPGGASTRPERDACTGHACRFGRLEQRVNSNPTRKPISWPFVRRL